MKRQGWVIAALWLGFVLLLALAWWGWSRGGLALMQLGVGC